MAKIKMNFTGVTEGFDPLPKGIFPATLFETKPGKALSSGKPKMDLTFKIQEPVEYANRQAWLTLSLQPQSLWRVKGVLIALGVPTEDLESEVEVDWDELLGVPCRLQIGHEMYDGTLRQRTLEVLPPAGPDEEAVQLFDEVEMDDLSET